MQAMHIGSIAASRGQKSGPNCCNACPDAISIHPVMVFEGLRGGAVSTPYPHHLRAPRARNLRQR